LRGEARLKRDAIFWHYPHYGNQGGTPASAMRLGDWKLIEFHEQARAALYNLAEDPGERRDLAGNEPTRTARLRRRLHAWLHDVGAQLPSPNPDYAG
jgi:arylsulfatase A-like enzyme